MSSDGKRRVTEALIKRKVDDEAEDLRSKLRKKAQGEKAAEEAIIQALVVWTGRRPDELGRLPIARDGAFIGYHYANGLLDLVGGGQHFLSGVTRGVWVEDTPVLKERRQKYERFAAALSDALQASAELNIEESFSVPQGEFPKSGTQEEQLLFAIGPRNAFLTSAYMVRASLRQAIGTIDLQLQERGPQVGRPRKEARYEVAAKFARLFALVTGERPTCSFGRNGPTGKFSLQLVALFHAIGWKDGDPRAPARAACDAITEADLRHPLREPVKGLMGLLGHFPGADNN